MVQPGRPDRAAPIKTARRPVTTCTIPVTENTTRRLPQPHQTKCGDHQPIQRGVRTTTRMILISFINPVDLPLWLVPMTYQMAVALELLCVMNGRRRTSNRREIPIGFLQLLEVVSPCLCLCPSLPTKCWLITSTTRHTLRI